MKDITLGIVFVEGIASFLSPCFLPLIPVYLGYLSGESVRGKRFNVIKNSIGFILGFTVIFVFLGATASGFGHFLLTYRKFLDKILGVLVILMGLFYTGIINPEFMNMEKRFSYKGRKTSFGGAILLGAAIGFGWTPCIGPILASVLAIAASKSSVQYGMYLLFIYSLGIAVPFLAAAVLMQGVSSKLKKAMKYTRLIKVTVGIILAVTGVFLYTGYFERLSNFFWR